MGNYYNGLYEAIVLEQKLADQERLVDTLRGPGAPLPEARAKAGWIKRLGRRLLAPFRHDIDVEGAARGCVPAS